MTKKIPSCYNCVFAYLDPEITLRCYTVGFLNYPACANHPESYGRMKRTPRCGICPNYRPKPETPQGDVRQIALGDGFTAYVDAKDYEWLSRWQWSMRGGYAARMEKRTPIYMHRAIANPPEGMIVDHKNRNKLDNTRDNLRVCTQQQNAGNRSKRRGTHSRFAGVGFNKQCGKHFAAVNARGERFFLGYFANEVEAARAHDAKAVELYGEFARLNFPEEWPPERRQSVYAQRDAGKKEGKKVERKEGKTMRKRRTEDRGRKGGKEKKSRAETQRRRGSRKTEDRGQRTAREKNRKSRVEPPRRKRRVGS
ncbi:MAG: HNH endonuclease [Candidatus Polarisedimenticolia bacterium]